MVKMNWQGKIPREGNGNPLKYSCLENSMDRGAWQGTVHGVAKSRTRLKQLSSSIPMITEMEMATHSSILAWRIPWTEEPGRVQSMELQRVRHD